MGPKKYGGRVIHTSAAGYGVPARGSTKVLGRKCAGKLDVAGYHNPRASHRFPIKCILTPDHAAHRPDDRHGEPVVSSALSASIRKTGVRKASSGFSWVIR